MTSYFGIFDQDGGFIQEYTAKITYSLLFFISWHGFCIERGTKEEQEAENAIF
jgi:hypothetical protein